jgi:hypothetical protein
MFSYFPAHLAHPTLTLKLEQASDGTAETACAMTPTITRNLTRARDADNPAPV